MNSKAFPFGVYTFDDTILSCQIVKCVKIVKIVKIVNLFQFLHQVRIGFLAVSYTHLDVYKRQFHD